MSATAALLDDGPSPRAEPHVAPGLAGVSETMLWTLYARATEAQRPDGILSDPACVGIFRAIDYDFMRHFGIPDGILAARAAEIDQALRKWLVHNPDGCVVSLGEGLETQALRVDNGRMRWLSVDLPDAIRLRERFLKPTERFRHIATGALDPAWADSVDGSRGVFIVAQGLLMYLHPDEVRKVFCTIADRFPGAEMVFDAVPRGFSRLTMFGLQKTLNYRLPPMPWGINRYEVRSTLHRWHPRLNEIEFLDYRPPRGPLRVLEPLTDLVPVLRNERPSLIHVTIGTARSPFRSQDNHK
jgi:O-methyltransferase involved in polyketide biosynthesis